MDTQAQDATDKTDGQTVKVPCEVYSRIVGYLRPISAWNDGKKAEWNDRVTFDSALRTPPISIENMMDDPEFAAWEAASDEALEIMEEGSNE